VTPGPQLRDRPQPADVRRASLAEAVLAVAATRPLRAALHGPEGVVTWGDLADRAHAVAAAYAGPRRLVLLVPRNDVGSVVEYLGALLADQVVLLAADAAVPGLLEAWDPDVLADPGTGRRTFRRTAGGAEDRSVSAHDLHPELSLLLSTSGSTGSPKLVRLSHEAVLANADAIADALDVREDDVAATALPLHYCYGLSVLHSHLVRGAALSLTGASVLDDEFWTRARRDGVTTFPGVPHTFDLLARRGFTRSDLPTLRYLTQAGGRMDPARVRDLAGQGAREGFGLVVMYGATEATARMAVLPPSLAAAAPGSIGRPLAGTTFALAPVEGAEPGVGELVFEGPNVMLGYAVAPGDLALGRTTRALHTGDLARQRGDGLWEVVGRRSRVAKVFGLRIDLDRAERELARRGVVVALADGDDQVVVGVASGSRPVDEDRVRSTACEVTGLVPAGLRLVVLDDLPRRDNGKVDHAALASYDPPSPALPTIAPAGARATAADVAALYARVLGRPDARPTDSFLALGGDSLSYVEVSLGLERLLGHLPTGWPGLPAAALVDVPAPAPRRGRLLETNVLLRAVAITSIVATHANLTVLLGGAHLLLAICGFNIGRFQLASGGRRDRVRALLRAAGRVALPSAAVIGVVAAFSDQVGWRQVVLLTSFTEWTWSEPRWSYWFIEALVLDVVLLAGLLAVPAVDRWSRRWPFGFPVGLVVVLLPTRYDWFGLPGDHMHRGYGVLWLLALGWAVSRARTTRQRVLVSVLSVALLPGFFGGSVGRPLYLATGLLVLVWLPQLRLPAWVARAVTPLAAASLWIYLLHWQVYPHLEHRWPLAATVLSLLAGVLAWRLASVLGRYVSHLFARENVAGVPPSGGRVG